jgi:hypothetical protein
MAETIKAMLFGKKVTPWANKIWMCVCVWNVYDVVWKEIGWIYGYKSYVWIAVIRWGIAKNTGRFIMFYVITKIYSKKTKGPTLMELFTAAEKLKKCFLKSRYVRCVHHGWQAHIVTIFKFLPHTRQHGCIDILHCCNDLCL